MIYQVESWHVQSDVVQHSRYTGTYNYCSIVKSSPHSGVIWDKTLTSLQFKLKLIIFSLIFTRSWRPYVTIPGNCVLYSGQTQYSRCHEEIPILSCSYLNRLCPSSIPYQQTCLSYRKSNFKHVLLCQFCAWAPGFRVRSL